MSLEFKLPELGEGVDSADVAEILVSEGDELKANQTIMELETEKAVAELPCPHAGKVEKIHVSEGDTISVGQVIMTIATEDPSAENGSEQPEAEQTEPEGQPEPEVQEEQEGQEKQDEQEMEEQSQPRSSGEKESEGKQAEEVVQEDTDAQSSADEAPVKEKTPPAKTKHEPDGQGAPQAAEADGESDKPSAPVPAGPATRRLARKLDVDLQQTKGSGPGGRITQEDVVHASHEGGDAATESLPALPRFEEEGPIERQPLRRLEKAAVDYLSGSWRSIPHVTHHALADVTEIEKERQKHNADAETSLSMTAILVKAAVGAVRSFPRFNSSLDAPQREVILKHYVNIGVAVDTPEGLVVPVIKRADQKSVVDIAHDLKELAQKAREGKLQADEMRGATFTISNQGAAAPMREGDLFYHDWSFTPIIPWPQVAILGASAAREQLVVNRGEAVPRLMLPLSLSYDHRVINGADATRFMQHLCVMLAQTFELFVET